jgi:hypothetical protein
MGRTTTDRLLPVVIALGCAVVAESAATQPGIRAIAWEDLAPPARARMTEHGIGAAGFPAFVDRLRREHAARIREGDFDHLVFYLLQSTHFTTQPPIEPALSAKSLVEALPASARERFLAGDKSLEPEVPRDVRARIAALERALDSTDRDARVSYFRALVRTTVASRPDRVAMLAREYFRAMRFLYQKEFVAQRAARPVEAVEDLYRSRGLSTDTAVEAGYLVYLGLGVVRSLEPSRQIRRVLIVGPGLDLAPRTGLLESGAPQSYQPWAVIDALISLGLARAENLQVVAADINPRVVEHLRRSRTEPPVLHLVSGIGETGAVRFSAEYRDYFTSLGRAIGKIDADGHIAPGHLAKTVAVGPAVTKTLEAARLDVVTQRLQAAPFDLAIATNILPYFDDLELTLAVGNIAGMLAPGGVFVHNEMRPSMQEIADGAGLSFAQSRQAIIATVSGAAAPLGDSVWLYRKAGGVRPADR